MSSIEEEHSTRWIHTHNAIHSAFIELIGETDLNSITVSEVAEKAHIHRKTFYLHYTSLDELFKEHIEELVAMHSKRIAELPLPYNYYDLSRVLFEFYTSSPEIESIFINPKYRILADHIITGSTQFSRQQYNPYRNFDKYEQELINTFVVYSSVNVWRRWVMSGKKVPMDKAVNLLGRMLEKGIEDIRAPYIEE